MQEQQYRHDSNCNVCGKLLAKSMMAIKNVSLSEGDYNRFRKGTTIRYGSQSMCRRCKRLREISSEVEFVESYGGTSPD